MTLTPYFVEGSPLRANGEAFLRVRVADGLNPNGFVRVWLPSGTPLSVRGSDLLQVNVGCDIERRIVRADVGT